MSKLHGNTAIQWPGITMCLPNKKTTKEHNHMSKKNCREATGNILAGHVAAPISEKVCGKLYCTLRISRIILKIEGLFKDLPKLPLKSRTFQEL